MKDYFTSNKLVNIMSRITDLLAYLCAHDESFTVRELSRLMNLSINQIRDDICALIKSEEFGPAIELNQDNNTAGTPDTSNDSEDSREELLDRIRRGDCDDCSFFIRSEEILQIPGVFPVLMSPAEYGLIKSTANLQDILRDDAPYRIKTPVHPLSDELLEWQDLVSSAIDNGQMLRFRYLGKGESRREEKRIFPLLLHHDINNNLLYCVDSEKQIYRLDRMTRLGIVKPDRPLPEAIDLTPFEYLWGMTALTEEPVDVKLRIVDNTVNILEKVRIDTNRRKHRKLYPDGDDYIYEDRVIGIENFRAWVRGYGASMIVLEPEWLARRLYDSAKRRLANYARGEFVSDTK